MFTMKPSDFAAAFGTTEDEVVDYCGDVIEGRDFRYSALGGDERDQLIIHILRKIEQDTQIIGATERKQVWQTGWAENLAGFQASGYSIDALVPKFVRSGQYVRLHRDYVRPASPNFELNYLTVYRQWVIRKFLPDRDPIYEFGAGTGFNLAAISRLCPDKQLVGLDFVPAAVDLMNMLEETHGYRIRGCLFDMLAPDYDMDLTEGCAVLTHGAIEQLAGQIAPFIHYLLAQRPQLCVHIEPVIDLYDENHLPDYLATMFHKKRGYTENLLQSLRDLESEGALQILGVKRSEFGSLYMEGYSLIVWKPTS